MGPRYELSVLLFPFLSIFLWAKASGEVTKENGRVLPLCMFTSSSISHFDGRFCNTQTKNHTRQWAWSARQPSWDINIAQPLNWPRHLSNPIKSLLCFSPLFCLSGLPLTLCASKVEMAIGSAEWLKAGELFSQVPANWGNSSGGIPTL